MMIVLDDEQRQAVESNARKILVVAGAGSGKTRVLTERVKRLLLDGVEPHNIVCITFTNLASQEMRERLCDVPGIGDVFIGTIHSFANRVYKESGIDYELLTTDKEMELYRNELMLFGDYEFLTFKRFVQFMDLEKQVAEGKYDEEELSSFLMPSERADLRVAERKIREVCKKRNILTFDELLEKTTEYYAQLGAEIEHVLVDEFQDVGTLEANFIFGLNAKNLFLVGDDWQSIYGFKGGNVGIFKRLLKEEGWTVCYLENNYRNTTEIVGLAETVIAQVDDRLSKQVKVMNQAKGVICIDTKYSLDRWLDEIKSSPRLKDWFILTRTNKEVMEIAEKLEQKGIAYTGFKRSGVTLQEMKELLMQDNVKLLTVHTSKGLENKNVLLYGNFPVKQKRFIVNDEERKVMYVGITRAMEQLVLLN